MLILKIVAFVFIALFLFLFFKDKRGDIALLISLAAGVTVLILILTQVTDLISFVREVAEKANIDIVYIGVVLKIIGIAYIASFATEICKDAGAASLGSKVELSGKILILVLAIPILMAVLDSILKIM